MCVGRNSCCNNKGMSKYFTLIIVAQMSDDYSNSLSAPIKHEKTPFWTMLHSSAEPHSQSYQVFQQMFKKCNPTVFIRLSFKTQNINILGNRWNVRYDSVFMHLCLCVCMLLKELSTLYVPLKLASEL